MTTLPREQEERHRDQPDAAVVRQDATARTAAHGMPETTVETAFQARPVKLARRIDLTALLTIVRITIARQSRGRRLLVIAVLFSLPIVIAIVTQRYQVPYDTAEAESMLVFGVIFQSLIPLTALVFASGMVQDDVEEQTLTYLLIRPVPRWAIYLSKLLATFLVAFARAVLFTMATLVAIHWGEQTAWESVFNQRAGLAALLLALCLAAYVTIFGFLSLWVRRTLVIGTLYIVVCEGVLANIDFVFRNATVMYHVRVLSVRWLSLPGADWSIDVASAPSASTCLIALLATSATVAVLGAWIFSAREFRVKTPEAS
jgi:ABC-2 type transport system permease protein